MFFFQPSDQSKGAPSKAAKDALINDILIGNIDGSSASECTKEKLPIVKKDLKPQTKMVAKNVKPAERSKNATKIKLIEVGNWEVGANANAKVPELSDELQPLHNIKKDLKPQIKMGVKNVKPAEKSKKDTVTDSYNSVTKLFYCQPCDCKGQDKSKSAKDFQNHLTSAAHQKVMKELESVHANTAGQIRMYAQFLENRKTAGKTGLKVSQR